MLMVTHRGALHQLGVLVGGQPKTVDGPGLTAPSDAPVRFQARIVQAHAVVEPALFQPHHLYDLAGHSLDERGGGGTALGSDLGRCFHPVQVAQACAGHRLLLLAPVSDLGDRDAHPQQEQGGLHIRSGEDGQALVRPGWGSTSSWPGRTRAWPSPPLRMCKWPCSCWGWASRSPRSLTGARSNRRWPAHAWATWTGWKQRPRSLPRAVPPPPRSSSEWPAKSSR